MSFLLKGKYPVIKGERHSINRPAALISPSVSPGALMKCPCSSRGTGAWALRKFWTWAALCKAAARTRH